MPNIISVPLAIQMTPPLFIAFVLSANMRSKVGTHKSAGVAQSKVLGAQPEVNSQ